MPWPSPNNAETLWSGCTLSSGGNVISSEYDQDSTRYLYARFYLEWACAVSASAGDYVEMYILSKEPGGTNYPDGASNVDPKEGMVDVFSTDWADSSTHYLTKDHHLLPNSDFKVLLKSEVADTMEITFKMQRYNEPTS